MLTAGSLVMADGEAMNAAWRAERSMGRNLSTFEESSRLLIVALDVADREAATKVVDRLGDVISFYKIGIRMHLLPGMLEFSLNLAKLGKDIFWDVKGGDIPESLRGYSSAAGQVGFKFLTIHGNGEVSDAAIQAAVEGKAGTDLKVLLVTVFTSLDDEDVRAVYKANSVRELVAQRVERAIRLGCDGVIASAQEAAMIRQIASREGRPDFLIVTPGIRPEGASAYDQKRIATPFHAIRDGANYLVIGRPIIEAADPLDAAQSIIHEIQRGLDARG